MAITEQEPTRSSDIAKTVLLSPATVIGILDRLESKGLILRERSTIDRRVVNIQSTSQGQELIKNAPSPLQDILAEAIENLPLSEQSSIAETFERVVNLMEIQNLDAAPILQTGPIDISETETNIITREN